MTEKIEKLKSKNICPGSKNKIKHLHEQKLHQNEHRAEATGILRSGTRSKQWCLDVSFLPVKGARVSYKYFKIDDFYKCKSFKIYI